MVSSSNSDKAVKSPLFFEISGSFSDGSHSVQANPAQKLACYELQVVVGWILWKDWNWCKLA